MEPPKITFRKFSLLTLSFLAFFSFIALPKPSCFTLYVVTYAELASMRREAEDDSNTAAEAIFRRIQRNKNNAVQFHFDPNDDEYTVYIETHPEEKRVSLYSERDEWRIVDYHQKIQHKKETASFVYWLGIDFIGKANFIEATRMFEYTKVSDPFFLPSYSSLFMLYQELGKREKANQNLNELENRFLTLRKYDPNYMIVIPQESVIKSYIGTIQETIENTQLLEVEIQKRKYTVLANVDLDPHFVSEKAYLYAPFMFNFREVPVLFPFSQQIE